MKLYLAASHSRQYMAEWADALYVLESFYYVADWHVKMMRRWKGFLLDSGAFSFMTGTAGKTDFEDYTRRYAEFVGKHDIEYFFELDIDAVVGLAEVERLRGILERETGRRCIPVWHKSRGKQYFLDMCKEYAYVAIGGLVVKDIRPEEYVYLKWFTAQARKRGVRVHGLGFTGKDAETYGFYSVDSTSWLSGARFGHLYRFDGRRIVEVKKSNTLRLADYRKGDRHNISQWILYQKFLDAKGVE